MAKIGQYYLDSGRIPMAATKQQGIGDPNAFGANAGQTMGNIGNAISGLGEAEFQEQLRQQEKRRKMNVLNAETNSQNEVTNLLYGPDGILHLQGENALPKVATKDTPAVPGVGDRAKEALAGIRQKYVSSLTDDQEKTVFGQLFDDSARSYIRVSMEHEAKQGDIAFQQSREASMKNYENRFAMLAASGDLEGAANALQAGKGIYDSTGKTLGTPKEVLGQESTAWVNGIIPKTILAQADAGNLDLALKIQSRFGKDMDANTKAIVEGKLKPILDNNELISFKETMRSKYDLSTMDGLNAAIEEAKTKFGAVTKTVRAPGIGVDGEAILQEGLKQEGKPYSLGADGTNATDCGLFTQQVFSAKGIDLGTRAADGQYRNMESQGKSFSDDNQLKKGDLVFWDVPGNRERWQPSNDPEAVNDGNKAYKGITHVGIYAGNGKVLQAGSSGVGYMDVDQYPVVGYAHAADGAETVRTVTEFDAIKQEKAINFLKSAAQDARMEKGIRKAEEVDRVKNALANTQSKADKISIIYNSNLEDFQKESLVNSINAAREKSDIGALYRLANLNAENKLTQDHVNSVANLLNENDFLKFSLEAAKIQRGSVDMETKQADKIWINEANVSFKDPKQRDAAVDTINQMLEGTSGWSRLPKARELIKQEVDSGKDSVVVKYNLANTTQYGQMENDFGPTPLRLTIRGFKSLGHTNPDAWEMNKFLSGITRNIEDNGWDSDYGRAYTYLINNDLDINPEVFAKVLAKAEEGKI